MRELALDDLWGDIVGFAEPFLGKTITSGIEWAGRKVGDWLGFSGESKDISDQVASTSSGAGPVTQYSVPDKLNNTNHTIMHGNYTIPTNGNTHLIKSFATVQYMPDVIQSKYIATCICPEEGPQRLPGIGFPTAMAHGTV